MSGAVSSVDICQRRDEYLNVKYIKRII